MGAPQQNLNVVDAEPTGRVLPLRLCGDPVLRKKSAPVADVTDEIRRLAGDMIATMCESNGIGLAAPQVGRRIRMIALCTFNPEIGLAPTASPGGGPAQGPAWPTWFGTSWTSTASSGCGYRASRPPKPPTRWST